MKYSALCQTIENTYCFHNMINKKVKLNKFFLAGEPTQKTDSLGTPRDSPTQGNKLKSN